MSFDLKLGLWRIFIRHTRSQAGMRPSAIVMVCPRFECLSDMSFIERNHKVETFSTSAADQALTKCIRLRAFIRSLEYGQAERLQRLIEFLRIDTVAVMDSESVSFIASHAFSKLLKRPLGSRMLRNVKVKNTSRLEFHDHKHINQSERCCRNDEEVGGDDVFGVVVCKNSTVAASLGNAPRVGRYATHVSRLTRTEAPLLVHHPKHRQDRTRRSELLNRRSQHHCR